MRRSRVSIALTFLTTRSWKKFAPDIVSATGFSVPPGDAAALGSALAQLARDPDLRARMGNAGRHRALDRYDEAKVLSRTLDLLGL